MINHYDLCMISQYIYVYLYLTGILGKGISIG